MNRFTLFIPSWETPPINVPVKDSVKSAALLFCVFTFGVLVTKVFLTCFAFPSQRMCDKRVDTSLYHVVMYRIIMFYIVSYVSFCIVLFCII